MKNATERLRSTAYLIGDRLRFKLERRSAERDASAWRARHPLRPTDQDRIVTYLVPIFERGRAPNWELVQKNLSRTLSAMRRQTDERWRVLVCSQDFPDVLRSELDERVTFLKYPVSHFGSSDKIQKLRYMARQLAKIEKRDGYTFFLDGDDIPHPRLTEFILNDNNGHGYYLPKGYCLDVQSGSLLCPLGEDGEKHDFTWHCGSSHAVRFDTRQDASNVLHVELRGDHMHAIRNLKDRVLLELQPVPFPAMIYVLNHGSSDQDLMKGCEGRQRTKEGMAEMSATDASTALEDFGVRMSDFS